MAEMTPEALAKARGTLGLSINQMADKLEVSRSTYIRWEQGQTRIVGPVKLAVAYLLEHQ